MQFPHPQQVLRDRHVADCVTIDNCVAVQLYVTEDLHTSYIVWAGNKKVRPAEKGLRIRDLRAGDVIEVGKDFFTVYAIEVYR